MRWLGLLIIMALLGAGAAMATLENVQERLLAGDELGLVLTPERRSPRVWQVMVIGSDARRDGLDGGARSDSVWLVRLDGRSGKVGVWALPRDWLVDIPGRGRDRLTNAYGIGRAPLLLKTVERSTSVNVDAVISIRFGAFSRLVNRLGCLYVDVDRRYFNENVGTAATNYANIDLRPGYQRLCGEDALSFARHRYSDDDLVRSRRQYRILRAAQSQWGSRTLLRSPTAATGLLPYVSTTLRRRGDLLGFAETMLQLRRAEVSNVRWRGRLSGPAVVSTPAQVRRMRALWEGTDGERIERRRTPGGTSGRSESRGSSSGREKRAAPRRTLVAGKVRVRVPASISAVSRREYRIPHGTTSSRAMRVVLRTNGGQTAGIQWVGWERAPRPDRASVRERGCGGWWWVSDSLTGDLTVSEQRALLKQVRCGWL